MPNLTNNYGLKKPLLEEFYDVNVQNENMDIIDSELKKKYDPDNKPTPDDLGASSKEHNHDDRYYDKSQIDTKLTGLPTGGHTHDDRYYTETEVDDLMKGKAPVSHGNHVPTTQTADSATFLRNDNTWQKVTPANIGAVSSTPVKLTSANDLNQTTTNGFYYWRTNNKPANVPTENGADSLTAMRVWTEDGITCTQEIMDMYSGSTHGCVMRRTVDGDEVYPWEWVNPPMEIGVEYRTVERYEAEPVFVTLQSDGTVKKRTDYHGVISPKIEALVFTYEDGTERTIEVYVK